MRILFIYGHKIANKCSDQCSYLLLILYLFSEVQEDVTKHDDKHVEEEEPPRKKQKIEKPDNSKYNKAMMEIRDHLARYGKLQRYSFKHLHHWATGIVCGQYSGATDEPHWEKHLAEIGEVPMAAGVLNRRTPSAIAGPSTATDDFLKQYMIMSSEDSKRRDENFRTMMLAMLGMQHQNPSAAGQPKDKPTPRVQDKAMHWDAEHVKMFLDENGFGEMSNHFLANAIDGPTLMNIDRETLTFLGIDNPLTQSKLLGKIMLLKDM